MATHTVFKTQGKKGLYYMSPEKLVEELERDKTITYAMSNGDEFRLNLVSGIRYRLEGIEVISIENLIFLKAPVWDPEDDGDFITKEVVLLDPFEKKRAISKFKKYVEAMIEFSSYRVRSMTDSQIQSVYDKTLEMSLARQGSFSRPKSMFASMSP